MQLSLSFSLEKSNDAKDFIIPIPLKGINGENDMIIYRHKQWDYNE